jgi:putative NADH-flavin reductase
MKVAVLGASGRAGSEITRELASRGHQVTAIARKPEAIPRPRVSPPCRAMPAIRRLWPA